MQPTIDPSDPRPLWEQVAAEIRRAIAEGEVSAGERMPLARDLATVLGVNRNTVLRALHQFDEAVRWQHKALERPELLAPRDLEKARREYDRAMVNAERDYPGHPELAGFCGEAQFILSAGSGAPNVAH